MSNDELRKFIESIEWNSVLNECDDEELMDDLFSNESRLIDALRLRRLRPQGNIYSKSVKSFEGLQRRRLFERLRDEIFVCFEADVRPTVDQVLKHLQERHPGLIADVDLKPLQTLISQIKQSTAPRGKANAAEGPEENFAPSTDKSPRIGQPSSVFVLEPAVPCEIPNCLCRK